MMKKKEREKKDAQRIKREEKCTVMRKERQKKDGKVRKMNNTRKQRDCQGSDNLFEEEWRREGESDEREGRVMLDRSF